MRDTDAKISQRQIFLSLLLLLLAGEITKPRAVSSAAGAKAMILGVGLDLILLSALSAYFIRAMKPFQKNFSFSEIKKYPPAALLLPVLLLSVGRDMAETNRFYRFVSEEYIPAWAFILLFLGVAVYGSCLGLEALARSSLPVAAMLMVSFLFLFLANSSRCAVENLQNPAHLLRDTMQTAEMWFHIPPEIFLCVMLQTHAAEKKKLHLQRVFLSFGILFVLLTLLAELVLGPFAALQQQPLHTLARIGSISVFTRLDSLHVSVWLLLSLLRISFYCFGISELVQSFVPHKKEKPVLLTALLLLASCAVAYLTDSRFLQLLITGTELLLVVFLPPYLHKKEKEI